MYSYGNDAYALLLFTPQVSVATNSTCASVLVADRTGRAAVTLRCLSSE